MRVLIAGFGDIGFDLGRKLSRAGHQVTGVRRDCPSGLKNHSVKCVSADLSVKDGLSGLPEQVDQIAYIVSPDARTEAAYRKSFICGLENLFDRYRDQDSPPGYLFVSSSSVYGQNAGEWVDENSPTEPKSSTARVLLEAEETVLAQGDRNLVVRFSGIYGPGRGHLIQKIREGAFQPAIPERYTNRIHSHDCVEVLSFLLEKQRRCDPLNSVYLATDDTPAPEGEVAAWLGKQLHKHTHKHLGKQTDQSQGANQRASTDQPVAQQYFANQCLANHDQTSTYQNKRCSNRRLKALGYQFRYPGYREGYENLLTANNPQVEKPG